MLIIETNYSKKLGLPGFSSHQYSITLRAEIADIKPNSARLRERAVDVDVRPMRTAWHSSLPVDKGTGLRHRG